MGFAWAAFCSGRPAEERANAFLEHLSPTVERGEIRRRRVGVGVGVVPCSQWPKELHWLPLTQHFDGSLDQQGREDILFSQFGSRHIGSGLAGHAFDSVPFFDPYGSANESVLVSIVFRMWLLPKRRPHTPKKASGRGGGSI